MRRRFGNGETVRFFLLIVDNAAILSVDCGVTAPQPFLHRFRCLLCDHTGFVDCVVTETCTLRDFLVRVDQLSRILKG